MTTARTFTPFVLSSLLAFAPLTAFAAAPIVVGNGTPGSCTETALKDDDGQLIPPLADEG